MTVLFTDLDNTLIYSYRHDIGRDKICVEIYQEREISFVTVKTWEMLKQVKEQTLLVPVTTRTQEQYGRINLKIGKLKFALVCNGGVLLEAGEENAEWYQQSLDSVSECQEQLKAAQTLMEMDRNRSFEVRNIRDLFLFTKSGKPEESVEYLRTQLNTEQVCVFQNGAKVYVLPRKLNKGEAVRRLLKRWAQNGINVETVMAAGDSAFDIPMLKSADVPFLPKALHDAGHFPRGTAAADESQVFSEYILEQTLRYGQKLCVLEKET